MMTGGDLFRRRLGSIKQVMDRSPKRFVQIGEKWVEEHYMKTVEAISPVDTGEYQRSHVAEVTERQITLTNTSNHAGVVEDGNSTHVAHRPIGTAVERERDKLSAMTREEIRKELT